MKQHHLSGLNIDLPALEQTAEGQLRGGFAMLGPSKSGKGPNTTCSGNGSCSGNGTCIGNITCDDNGYCVNTTTNDSACGGNVKPDPGVQNPTCS